MYLLVLYLLEQATTKINVAVDKLPKFKCCKLGDPSSGPQHVGTIHIGSERFATFFVCVQYNFLHSSMEIKSLIIVVFLSISSYIGTQPCSSSWLELFSSHI